MKRLVLAVLAILAFVTFFRVEGSPDPRPPQTFLAEVIALP